MLDGAQAHRLRVALFRGLARFRDERSSYPLQWRKLTITLPVLVDSDQSWKPLGDNLAKRFGERCSEYGRTLGQEVSVSGAFVDIVPAYPDDVHAVFRNWFNKSCLSTESPLYILTS